MASDEVVKAAAERLIHEVEVHVAEYGNPLVVPNLQTDIYTVARFALEAIQRAETNPVE